ncbi:ADP-ribosylglycohydrolase [Microlunatus sagamiharensis]|uniref:ADP-ribosylglycohydrolase n=1 Tax=Microlunatus sagamiharensis TaxID=546874 RepID=A0A1H2LKD2_9ACTN|nr:ADP-ribosylglycohydrolase family protein [Microlunatus sagamiharensis]SDU81195.1 ADP-ribosylglycohydrolase [Microlunatus sagamiharensis]
MTLKLTTAQYDRAAGVLLALAAGDALGAGYEFGPPLDDDVEVRMQGGGSFGWAPGEWTDDTSMAVAIAEVSAEGLDLRSAEAQDRIAARWLGWSRNAKDVGIQTGQVLGAVTGGTPGLAERVRKATADLHRRTGRTAGNGSLMRTAPVALARLDDPDALVEAAHALSAITHADPEAGEACALWCLAIRHAVLEGTFDGLRLAVDALPADRRAVWTYRLDLAEELPPSAFTRNGWVVEALQGAWSAIARTVVPTGGQPGDHLRLALEAAVRGGHDTDTVAAIAGSLLGARWGASAVPSAWRRVLHGWPGLRGRDLVRLAVLTARGGRPDGAGWPSAAVVDYSIYESSALARHPQDEHVWLAGVGAFDDPPPEVDAVVSLCRLGAAQVPVARVAPEDHVEVWLVDSADPAQNPNLDLVLADAVDAVAALRAEGRTVLLHCVQAQSRTPTVAALYGARVSGQPAAECLVKVQEVLPGAHPNQAFLEVIEGRSAEPARAGRAFGAVAGSRSLVQDREITLTANEADQLLVILDDVVGSLDRIGSREAAGEDPGHEWVHEYFSTGGATRRLSHARRILSKAFARVYTDDEQAEIWDQREWPVWAVHLPEIARKPDDR